MKKNILITGVFGGIGYATAKIFSKKGWSVIGIDKQKREDTHNAIDFFIERDISKTEEIDFIWDTVKHNYSAGIAGLVNNAGHQVSKGLLDTTEEDWDTVFATNVKAAFLLSKYAHPHLSLCQGAIVNVSSVHAFATSKNISSYAASKGALLAFTRALALEFAEGNIRVNCVIPGATNTPMLTAGFNRGLLSGESIAEQLNTIAMRHPMKRVGEAEDIAKLVYFLIDNEQSAFITGQSFVADGGALAQLSTEVGY